MLQYLFQIVANPFVIDQIENVAWLSLKPQFFSALFLTNNFCMLCPDYIVFSVLLSKRHKSSCSHFSVFNYVIERSYYTVLDRRIWSIKLLSINATGRVAVVWQMLYVVLMKKADTGMYGVTWYNVFAILFLLLQQITCIFKKVFLLSKSMDNIRNDDGVNSMLLLRFTFV